MQMYLIFILVRPEDTGSLQMYHLINTISTLTFISFFFGVLRNMQKFLNLIMHGLL